MRSVRWIRRVLMAFRSWILALSAQLQVICTPSSAYLSLRLAIGFLEVAKEKSKELISILKHQKISPQVIIHFLREIFSMF